MVDSWIKSPTGRRILVHWADQRPAWLWSEDGDSLLWRNEAARYFHGRLKKSGVKFAPEAVPIKGQVARLLRLGAVGRSSLSRIQFLAGGRPLSTTCTVTPLDRVDGTRALLIVGVDPIDAELMDAPVKVETDTVPRRLLPPGADYLVVTSDGEVTSGSAGAIERYAQTVAHEGVPKLGRETRTILIAGSPVQLTSFKASPRGDALLLFEPVETDAEADRAADVETPAPMVAVPDDEPLLPMGLEPQPPPEPPVDAEDAEDAPWVPPIPEPAAGRASLASLFDRLVDDNELYAPLDSEADAFAAALADDPLPIAAIREEEGVDPVAEPLPPQAANAATRDAIADLITAAATQVTNLESEPEAEPQTETETAPAETVPAIPVEPAKDDAQPSSDAHAVPSEVEPPPQIAPTIASEPPTAMPVTTWRIIGRGFVPVAEGGPRPPDEVLEPPPEDLSPTDPGPLPDPETVERVSRYNFDELSRILTDRVANPIAPMAQPVEPTNEGALVTIAGETLILNRLPIGILVFRDQQVLFANRALIDLVGYESVEGLRRGGLASIFPTEDSMVGPVTQLVRRDGRLTAVNARLQSITWHARPALMLSALAAETRIGHEGAVRTFAELAAQTADEGFLTADRSGLVTLMSLHGRILLGLTEAEATGRPLSAMIEPTVRSELQAFLERPARFAETARPSAVLPALMPTAELVLFVEGQAGIVAGYFGFVRKRAGPVQSQTLLTADDGLEPSMLARISRGIRRPLNTVIGFAEMMRNPDLAPAEPQRYVEYARDIKTAGEEIATLVVELDDYARLRDGRYPVQVDDLDLTALLETCLQRVRGQAGDARVLVRSAISDRLPRIAADRASLTQAVLNLLASAIDQTPAGGSVILSAQREDNGGLTVNVRDSGDQRRDLGERFVVFRDGLGRNGEMLAPVRSSVGLALTRSLLAVNALKLSVDPMASTGTRFSMLIPAELVKD